MFPNTATLAELRTAVRQRADQVNSEFISDSELNSWINLSRYELYDLLIQKYGSDYYAGEPQEFSLTPAQSTYPLPDDFYKLLGVDASLSGGDQWITLAPFNLSERNRGGILEPRMAVRDLRYKLHGSNLLFLPTPATGSRCRIWYVPRLAPLVSDTDIADGISGWLEFVIVDCAIKCLAKEESDPSIFLAQKQALILRIEAAADNRDAGGPITVSPPVKDDYFGWGS